MLMLKRNQQNRSSRNSIKNNIIHFISIKKRFRIDKKVQKKHSIGNTIVSKKFFLKKEYVEFYKTTGKYSLICAAQKQTT